MPQRKVASCPTSRLSWERIARQAEGLGVRVVTLRTGLVLGRDGGMLMAMRQAFALGLGGRFGDGRQWMSWIHKQDLIGLILHAATDAGLRGALNGTAPLPVRNADFVRALATRLRRPAIFHIPAAFLQKALGEMSELFLASQRVLPRKAEQSGYHFRFTSLEEALNDLVD